MLNVVQPRKKPFLFKVEIEIPAEYIDIYGSFVWIWKPFLI